ncbi:regulator of G-protein signaling 7-like isoform X2 [Dermatophagoides farinae]|uniref:regulator of G-protein signaling 7-like isoform X2 n=1 Tax=Dermatophagoides farinae TaxID=6954 RepID=UPI001F0E7731|nr:regulator of G-protein signaling 7-like isoform X2 [Dermatophagoides farinae]
MAYSHTRRHLKALSEASNSAGNNGDGSSQNDSTNHCENWNPNQIVYNKMEQIIDKMQDEQTGVPVRTVKSFMSKIPSVFNGSDLIAWMMRELDLDDQQEALHLANLMASHGYFFPIDDHVLCVKADNTFYRFQTPYFWPSNCWEPENTDYAVYLCKRTMQNKTRLELADYEAENLARLQKMFSRKWEFIFMQAEAQAKVDKKRDKLERKVLDSQERAFWDVHRPPGSVNTTEIDIKKACRMHKPLKSSKVKISTHLACSVGGGRISPVNEAEKIEILKRECDSLRIRLDHRIGGVKISKITESYSAFYEQWAEYDPFVTPLEPSKGTPLNPWISDSPEFWEMERQTKDVPCRRVRRWAFSLKELLKDAAGREQFFKFLEKEFSAENLKFWDAVQELKCVHTKDVASKVQEIWNEYLGSDANCPINIDSKSYEITKKNMENNPNNRWIFDEAAGHVYQLMKNDSYPRYLRSDMYKEYLNGTKKKTSVKGFRGVIFTAKKVSDQLTANSNNPSSLT